MSRTCDDICRGELKLWQSAQGYRFNLDALLLAHFAGRFVPEVKPGRVVDLCAGCGIVGLLLARRFEGLRASLIEVQQTLAELCRANIAENALEDRVDVIEADLRLTETWGRPPPDLIVCNPPFFPTGSGRPSPDPEVAMARHELGCTLEGLIRACASVLPQGKTLVLIHLFRRRDELLHHLRSSGLGPVQIQPVQALPERPPHRLLVRALSGWTAAAEEDPPLLVNLRPGCYSDQMAPVLGENPSRSPF